MKHSAVNSTSVLERAKKRADSMRSPIYGFGLVLILVTALAGQAGAESVSIPKTGQMVSEAFGDDGDLQNGVAWPTPRFADHLDGTATDGLTGLMWTQDAFLAGKTVPWIDAHKFVADMNTGTLPNFGYSDWRLPNINELESLLDYGVMFAGLPASHPFSNVQGLINQNVQYVYWSSTSVWNFFGQAKEALAKSMPNARTMNLSHSDPTGAIVWPIRGPDLPGRISLPRTGWKTPVVPGDDGSLQLGVEWPRPRLVDNGDGTVTDKLTRFMWTQNANTGQFTWQDALDHIAEMNTGAKPNFGHTDWRLPNAREQRSLLDFGKSRPPLPNGGAVFTDVVLGPYWTSTAWSVFDTSKKAVVDFNFARDVYFFETSSVRNWIWPVRDGAPMLMCSGFESPMDRSPVSIKKNRALPLKAQLFDADDFMVTDLDIMAPPVIQVQFTSAIGEPAVDVTDDAYPAGEGTEGNQFEYSDDLWRFNLKTRNQTAAGIYTISMISGNDLEYVIDPTCEAAFLIE